MIKHLSPLTGERHPKMVRLAPRNSRPRARAPAIILILGVHHCMSRSLPLPLLLLAAVLLAPDALHAQETLATPRAAVEPLVLEADVSQQLEPRRSPWQQGDEVVLTRDFKQSFESDITPTVTEAFVPRAVEAYPSAALTGAEFDGIPATGRLPPDTVGDVGPTHYIQAVNTAFAIYEKNTGTILAGPLSINSLWSGFGGPCESLNSGDPIVNYDHLAGRWLISQFALEESNYHQCFAISRSGDPVGGGWFLYAFPTVDTTTDAPIFPDYPKIAVWPDGYYMGTQRGFPSHGLDVWAFDRESMLAGRPAAAVQFAVPAPSIFLMPSDLEGPAPPQGTPNFFIRQVDGQRFGGADRLELFEFRVDWRRPEQSTFTQLPDLNTQEFDSILCAGTLLEPCIPQPGDFAPDLEALTAWPMWRLQFRSFGHYEAMVINHTVNADGEGLAGIRWYELRRSPGGAWAIFQQGTYAPDSHYRWMGSAALDKEGNIAIGYNIASQTEFPGVRAVVRHVTDPPGKFRRPELVLVRGEGAQTYENPRFGNYSTLVVDPTDGCTFWYTGEYYSETSEAGWRTRVAAFVLPSCAKVLARDGSQPTLRQPVPAGFVEHDLAEVPPVSPASPGAPVRVTDDLRTSSKDQ